MWFVKMHILNFGRLPKMGECQDINRIAFQSIEGDKRLIYGVAFLDTEITIADDMGSIEETNEIYHIWVEKDGKIIDCAKNILSPAKIIKYVKIQEIKPEQTI